VKGSFATSLYGESRLTNDLDVVVDLPEERVRDFVAAFPSSDYYVSIDAVRDAVRRKSMFNIIHLAEA
jgi:hypothetical protein